jgi:protein-S-isoprenylcysteine O-methyltransferase Ste14
MQRTVGLWAAVAALGSVCLVTMVVPMLAVLAGGYLSATGRYVAALAVVLAGGGAVAVWWWRRSARVFHAAQDEPRDEQASKERT